MQDRKVKKWTIHPLFKPDNLHYDFAVIHLETPFEFSEHIRPICLPDPVASTSSFANQECFATGWGKDSFGKQLFDFHEN